MADQVELYDTEYSDRPDTITITFKTSVQHKVTGTGVFPWGLRRRVSAMSDGSYDSMLDALIKVWLTLPDTDWNVFVKDPKSGSIVKMPRTEEMIDGLTKPRMKPEDVAHIALELGKAFYPDVFPEGLFGASAEGESKPPEAPEDSSEPEKEPKPRQIRGAKPSSSE